LKNQKIIAIQIRASEICADNFSPRTGRREGQSVDIVRQMAN
jgi:hypothetical protein